MRSSDGSYESIVHSFQPSVLGEPHQPQLGVVVKRCYRLVHDNFVEPFAAPDEALEIHDEPVYLPTEHEPMLAQESDLTCFYKRATDVIVHARCYAHGQGGRGQSVVTGVAVGSMHKQVRVWGDRIVRPAGDGVLTFEASQAFDTVPIAWTHAYGGIDVYASRALALNKVAAALFPFARNDNPLMGALGYVRNRFGRGYWLNLDIERLDGMLAPNLDDPNDPVTPERLLTTGLDDWTRHPVPASYGAMDAVTFPRCAWLGIAPPSMSEVEALSLHEVRVQHAIEAAEIHTAEPNPRRYNCAAPGLGQTRLRGGEGFRLLHLHRRHRQLDGWLPRSWPTLYLEPPNTRQYELKATLGMVIFEPDEDRVTLTWTGAMPVAAEFPEAMCEAMPHAVAWS